MLQKHGNTFIVSSKSTLRGIYDAGLLRCVTKIYYLLLDYRPDVKGALRDFEEEIFNQKRKIFMEIICLNKQTLFVFD